MLSRRHFLSAAGAAGFAACAGTPADERPNILWIIGEDFSPNLGCYGDPDVSTPRIDQLAAEGVLYTHACVTAPVCSAARSALATGMYQTTIGAHNHRSHRDDDYRLPDGVRVFTDFFREAGYHTSNLKDTSVGGRGKTDFNFNIDHAPFDAADWSDRNPGQPFYAQINFQETHRSFTPSPSRPIDPATVHLAPYYPDHPAVRKDYANYLEAAQTLDANVGRVLDRLEEEGLTDSTIVAFLGDHGAALPRGKQFLYEEGMRIPLIIRIPAKYRPEDFKPGTKSDKLVSHIDLTATSLALAGIARPEGMEARVFIGPETDAPREFLFCARDRCDETVDRIRAVRTRSYKYIRNFLPERPYTQPNHYKDTSYPSLQVMRQLDEAGELTVEQGLFMSKRRPEEEFYDLEVDPFELHNLAGSPEHQQPLSEMRGALEEWIEVTGDKGQVLEDPLPAEYETRTAVGGWITSSAVMTPSDGALDIALRKRQAEISAPWVAEGGDFTLELRMKADRRAPSLGWATVDNLRGEGNRAKIALAADGEWHEATVSFQADGWLARIVLEFPAGEEARAQVAWARLKREGKVEKEWRFAG